MRPAAAGQHPRFVGVGLLRALFVTLGLSLLGILGAWALSSFFGKLQQIAGPPTGPAIWTSVLIVNAVLLLSWLRLTLPVTLGKAALIGVAWTIGQVITGIIIYLALVFGAAEAAIVPTGAMASTILGHHKNLTCPNCNYRFTVNSSQEAEPSQGPPVLITGCTCPNCRSVIDRGENGRGSTGNALWIDEGGDRILYGKGFFGAAVFPPRRDDLIVMQYPDSPPTAPPINYVKRVIGLPGETIAIQQGHLFALASGRLQYNDQPFDSRPLRQMTHADDQKAKQQFGAGEFEVLHKDPDQILVRREIVFDNDFQSPQTRESRRWRSSPERAIKAMDTGGFNAVAPVNGESAWLRYRHIIPGRDKPGLITDFSGFNSFQALPFHPGQPGENWVGDLILECEIAISQQSGDFILELSRGPDRFRATFDLDHGTLRLTRQTDDKEVTLGGAASLTALSKTGNCELRMANVDQRITVWVAGQPVLVQDYSAPMRNGPSAVNDLEPASIGVRSATVQVQKLKLWRSTYCTTDPGRADITADVDWSEPSTWKALSNPPVRTFYVQPEHYFVLGDNSMESSDSRSWGLVPRSHLLGRVVFVYYPIGRAGIVR
jgi:signal peptidase I